MIREFEFFHGVVFARLLHSTNSNTSVRRYGDSDNASYVLNDSIGIYVKYSAKRLPPWRFSFQKRHQDHIREMRQAFEKVFLVLVCNDDGIVVLSFEELGRILDDVHDETEWVSVVRNKREMYGVAGSDGKLGFKIGKHDFPQKVLGTGQIKSEEVPPAAVSSAE